MSAKTNIDLVRRLYEEIDKGHIAILDEAYAPDFIEHDASFAPPSTPGIAALKEGFERFAAAFEDSRHEIVDIFAAGDKVVVRISAHGIHRGEYLGAAPTGKRVSMAGIAIYRMAGGKIVEEWSQDDRLGFLRQIGLIP